MNDAGRWTYERLANRGDGGSVQGMAGDDVRIFRKVFFECGSFRCFYGGLASNDGVLLCG